MKRISYIVDYRPPFCEIIILVGCANIDPLAIQATFAYTKWLTFLRCPEADFLRTNSSVGNTSHLDK